MLIFIAADYTSEELTDFLDKNLQPDSIIDVIFSSAYDTRKTLKKKHIKELNKMMEFYRRLKQKKAAEK